MENKINKMAKDIKKLEGKPVVLDGNYCRYFSPEYYCNLRQLAVIDALVNGRLALKTAVPLINYTFELISTV